MIGRLPWRKKVSPHALPDLQVTFYHSQSATGGHQSVSATFNGQSVADIIKEVEAARKADRLYVLGKAHHQPNGGGAFPVRGIIRIDFKTKD